MKLLLCLECSDVIKLDVDEVRMCKCGKVKGGYNKDGLTAWVNGNGYSLAFNNHELVAAIKAYKRDLTINRHTETTYPFEAYLRAHEGKTNPNTVIKKEK